LIVVQGRVVLVTGGSSGIGYATARRLASRGARVIITARDTPRLRAARTSLWAELGRPVESIAADLTSAADRERLVDWAVDTYGQLDALVNNAAVGRVDRLAELSADDVSEVITTNLIAVADLTRLALPHLRRTHGDVVMISSAMAVAPAPPLSLYSATKSGVHGLVTALRREERDVQVHEVLPGLVATEWLAYALGWRANDASPHADTTVGSSPERIAADVERCLTADSARTVSSPRVAGLARLAALPPVAQLVDVVVPRIADRVIAWSREYGERLGRRGESEKGHERP
jgi:short-subunit dehydrogenase